MENEPERQIPQGDLRQLQQILGQTPASPNATSIEDAVFVCIDCEAFEMDQNKVTEVGVSIFDSGDAKEPATMATIDDTLFSKILSSHYRVSEYGHLRNKRFSKGNPDAFGFGQSTWVRQADVKQVLESLFRDAGRENSREPRNIVLVGHALKHDIDYLRKLNFNCSDVPNIVLKMDTQNIATSKKQMMALGKLLTALGIDSGERKHNAGNDAAYTLRALLAIAVSEHADPGSTVRSLDAIPTKKKGPRGPQPNSMRGRGSFRRGRGRGPTDGVNQVHKLPSRPSPSAFAADAVRNLWSSNLASTGQASQKRPNAAMDGDGTAKAEGPSGEQRRA